MMWSEAILMMTKNVKFFKKCRQSEVKEFFKDLGRQGRIEIGLSLENKEESSHLKMGRILAGLSHDEEDK